MTDQVVEDKGRKKKGKKRPLDVGRLHEMGPQELGPGEILDVDKKDGKREFKWELQQYHLTYKGWIDLVELQNAVKEGFPRSSFVAFSMVHESADDLNPYRHTHWYFKIDKKCGSRGSRLMDINGVHPHVRKIYAYGDHGAYLMDAYHMKEKEAFRVQYGRENIKNGGQRQKEISADVITLASDGKLRDIAERYPSEFLRWHRVIKDVSASRGVVDVPVVSALQETDNYWWYGPPNTGKSTFAKEYLRKLYGEEPYVMSSSTRWVDGYKYQKGFIIEETCPSSAVGRAAFYKQLLDIFPVKVECKGGSLDIRPVTVIVTSNYHPSSCFSPVDSLAILARVTLRLFEQRLCERKKYDAAKAESANNFVDQRIAEVFANK